ncbi:MAG: hypothetical protein KDB18_13640, partial [Salinibacterium sp.]|nr:hypothetical protein [Salinibacterium sp.]
MTTAEHRREPCSNCPFRRSARLAHWHPTEYIKLHQMEKSEGQFGESGLFNCHKDRSKPANERQLCVGWLQDQRRKGVPSLALRLKLISDHEAQVQFAGMSDDDS